VVLATAGTIFPPLSSRRERDFADELDSHLQLHIDDRHPDGPRRADADVLRLVVIEGMKPTLLGLIIGIASAAALSRVMATLVFGVTTPDAATFLAVSLIVIAVGLAASLVPGIRATRINPLQALRTE
jgi:hypothetical protein